MQPTTPTWNQHRETRMVAHPDINPAKQHLTSAIKWKPVSSLGQAVYPEQMCIVCPLHRCSIQPQFTSLATIISRQGFKLLTLISLNLKFTCMALFVNRYVEEHVQKTGVAIETQGFTFVTSGRKRESLTVRHVNFIIPEQTAIHSQEDALVIQGTINLAFVQQGNATLHLYPHFKSLQDLEGNINYQKDWTITLLIIVIIY